MEVIFNSEVASFFQGIKAKSVENFYWFMIYLDIGEYHINIFANHLKDIDIQKIYSCTIPSKS